MKKIITIVIIITIMLATYEQDTYATDTLNDATTSLTSEERDTLSKYVDDELLDILDDSECKYILNHSDDNIIQTKSIYVVSTSDVASGEVIDEKRISEKTAYQNLQLMKYANTTLSDDGRTATVETNMKKITLKLTSVGYSTKAAEIECRWLTIPKCKSYDLIGIRLTGTTVTIDSEGNGNISGTQTYDGKKIEYDITSKNVKCFSNGVGISMNIPDDVKSTLSMKLAIKYGQTNSTNTTTVYGSYQHATEALSLSKSQKYNLEFNGMGGVFLFKKDSIANIYDNTPGLYVIGKVEEA